MCGRYGIFIDGEFYEQFQPSNHPTDLRSSYNVAPGSFMPVIVRNSPNKIETMKWGLIPHWAKDPKIGYKMINARAETVAEKPSFKSALQKRRCIVPASGYYEWKVTESGKIPYWIHLKNANLFPMAGLYDIWLDGEKRELKSFTIITTSPNQDLSVIHNRMPVILTMKEVDRWLDSTTSTDELLAMLDAYPQKEIEAYSVSRDVNKFIKDDSSLIERFVYPDIKQSTLLNDF